MKYGIIVAITASSIAIGAQAAPLGFTDFVGFGDSLSDKGRLPEALATQPPQDGSRFSDGPTWMEILGERFAERGGSNVNLALGGATAGENTPERAEQYAIAEFVNGTRDASDPDDIPFSELGSFAAQVGSFLTGGLANTVGDNPFVTVLLGGNDFRRLPDAPTKADFQTVASTVISSIVSGISTLIMADPAKYNDFMVSNLPSFTKVPSLFETPEFLTDPLDEAIEEFNFALSGSLDILASATGTNIEIFDLYSTFEIIYDDGISDGLIPNVACLEAGINNCPNEGDSAAYLFFDDIHPNSFIQSGIGAAALAQVAGRIAPVPLPAGLPLLLAGIGVFGVMRRKHAA